MVHSVELLFDAETESAVRGIWDDLMAVGVRSQAAHTSPSNRPHVTLTVADRMDDAVTAALRPALARLPLECRIGAPMVFGGRSITLVRLVVPSAELLDLQADVHRICLAHTPDGPLVNVQPGEWTPHVTLARRVSPDQLPKAVALRQLGREIRGRITGLRHWDGNAKVVHPIEGRN
jgi:2'-5' RNA ligase